MQRQLRSGHAKAAQVRPCKGSQPQTRAESTYMQRQRQSTHALIQGTEDMHTEADVESKCTWSHSAHEYIPQGGYGISVRGWQQMKAITPTLKAEAVFSSTWPTRSRRHGRAPPRTMSSSAPLTTKSTSVAPGLTCSFSSGLSLQGIWIQQKNGRSKQSGGQPTYDEL